jgi:hypothetical protein
MNYICTHVSPDWDAIGAVWMLKRFHAPLKDAWVGFVNTGKPDHLILHEAAAVVDIGREYDPARLRFDHHQLPRHKANDTSATLQVFHFLTDGMNYMHPLFYLNQIVALIYSGDTGKKTDGADWSRIEGIHALLCAQKARKLSDIALMDWGFEILDLLAESTQARYTAQNTLAEHTVYKSDDGLVIALHNAPPFATNAAHEAGARLVMFYSEHPDVPTYARGVMRAGEWQEPHCGDLINWICNDWECGLMNISKLAYEELACWYKHEAGFFAGKGTQKAPCTDPMLVDIRDIALAIDEAWQR